MPILKLELPQKLPNRLSRHLATYLYSLKENNKNEVYETLVLMILNDNFLEAIENLIKKNLTTENLKKFKLGKTERGIKFRFKPLPSKEYEHAVDLVCNSNYFIKNFTKKEIRRKKTIALNLTGEMLLQSIFLLINKKFKFNLSAETVEYPLITHEVIFDKGVKKTKVVFEEGTPLNELIGYLKKTLKIKNNPQKKMMSLGKSFRMLQIENDIKLNAKYNGQKFEYVEYEILKEMEKQYHERLLSTEAVAKSLQRIKRIKKEMSIVKKDR